MYLISSSCFDMILDKGGGCHGHHVCVKSVAGSLLLLLTLTHRRQGVCAGRLPCGGGGRAEARGGGKGGCVTGFPLGEAPRSSRQRQERRRLPLLLLLLRGRRCRHTPARPRGRSAVQSGPTDKKYLVKKIIVKNIASVQQINFNNQNINCLAVETINCRL